MQAIDVAYESIVASGAGRGITARKSGNVITINGYIRTTSAIKATQTLIGTLPAGARPGDAVRANVIMCDNPYEPGDNAYLLIGTAGNIEIKASASNGKLAAYFSCAYIAQN